MLLRAQHHRPMTTTSRSVVTPAKRRVATAAADTATTAITATTPAATDAAPLLARVAAVAAGACRDYQSGEPVDDLSALLRPSNENVALIALSHFGDLTSFELAQKIARRVLPALNAQRPRPPPSLAKKIAGASLPAAIPPARFVLVGLGSQSAAQLFAQETGLEQAMREPGCPPVALLCTESASALYRQALELEPGFAPDADGVSPYAKLLVMLAGLGSDKGATLRAVLRGYTGDRNADPWFLEGRPEGAALGGLFGVVGKGFQRPFELATQRLINMNTVLSKWGDLAPPAEGESGRMLVQQGGAFVFGPGAGGSGSGGVELRFQHRDAGILCYVDTDDLTMAMLR
jgi:hypothetical protein